MMWALFCIVVLAPGSWAIVHVRYRRAERRRFHEDRERYRAERLRAEADDEQARLLDRVREQFPHAVEELEARLAGDAPSDVSVRSVLSSIPGVRIGVTTDDLPVVIPDAARTRHLCCWGRTGTGKTSLALRLIHADLLAGRGIVVLSAEREFFRDHVLPLVPENRISQVHYFAPGLPDCPVFWNPFEAPDDDRARAAAELFTVFRSALSEDTLGPQSDPIARNTFLALAGMPGATFLTARAFLEDREFRKRLLPRIEDEWCRKYFEKSFEQLPRSAARPFLNRLEKFNGAPGVRRGLCRGHGNMHLGTIVDDGEICFVDLAGFDPDTTRLLGHLILAHLQIVVMRRERMPEHERRLCMLYADEFHELVAASAGSAETVRQLLSKGRRYLVSVNAFSQYPGQLDAETRAEVFGNCGTFCSLALSSQDAATVRRELLLPSADGLPEPVAAEALVSLPIGCGYIRTSTGALAVPVRLDPPLEPGDPAWGQEVRLRSWARFVEAESHGRLVDRALDDSLSETRPGPGPATPAHPNGDAQLSPDEQRLLDAVRAAPGRKSSDYAKLARMSGAAALACRHRLVAAGLLREHQVATGRRGRQAIVLEPIEKGPS